MTGTDTKTPRILDWDCAFFGATIATLPPEARSEAEIESALAWCRARGVQCLYALSDDGDAAKRDLLARHGARETDVRTTLSAPVAPVGAAARNLRPARGTDLPALEAIARAAHADSRFWNDPRFARERCAELYATWIRNGTQGRADTVLVAAAEDRAVGYITCHVRGTGAAAHGEIGLVAVAEDARGRGLGGALVDGALEWAASRGLRRMEVVTQGRNAAALRLYESRGFVVERRQVWQHLWFDEARP